MLARIAREGEVVVIHLSGRVDVETAEPFRRACLDHLLKEKVVFDLSHLSFVGSSGLLPFMETLQKFSRENPNGFKFSGVGSEFRKLFAATALASAEIYENCSHAVVAYADGSGIARVTVAAVEAVPVIESEEPAEFGMLLSYSTPEDNPSVVYDSETEEDSIDA